MTTLKEDPIQERDISEYLSGQDDFRLEIAVFHACRSHGLNTSHGGTYEDPVTKKTRQYDIRASIKRGVSGIRFAIECKSLKDYFPLLVSTLPRLHDEAFHEVVVAYERTKGQLASLALSNAQAVRVQGDYAFYEEGKAVGKSTAQVGRSLSGDLVSGDSEVFVKCSQAVSSAFDLVSDSTADYENYEEGISLCMVIPILVINDGSLWVANYSTEGTLIGKPAPSDSCEIYLGKSFWTGPMGIEYHLSHLHVFTKSTFGSFLDRLVADEHFWSRLFPLEELKRRLVNRDNV